MSAKTWILMAAAAALASCATTSSPGTGPNGRPMYRVTGYSTASKAYQRASEVCPAGYDILSSGQHGAIVELDVECR